MSSDIRMTYQKILVAVDFSAHSDMAIRRAVKLAQLYGANVELLHVVEIPIYPVLEDVAVMGMPGLWDDKLSEELIDSANTRLNQLAEQFSIDKYLVLPGLVDSEIVSHANQQQCDLIVMGFHGVSGLKKLIGSTTNSVINSAECDVLAVKID